VSDAGERPDPVDPDAPVDHAVWEQHARWWQEGFTAGADPEYEESLLPLAAHYLRGAGRVLDVGTGEGQVARTAAGLASGTVVGVDVTWAQISMARQRGGGPVYARALAQALPFPPASFDAVLASLVFEHIADLDPAIAEVGRVLRPGGRFLLFLNHPILQAPGSGWVVDDVLDEQYWRIGPYLPVNVALEEIAPGVVLPFVHRPLSGYVNTIADHGMYVERMEEPAPPPGFVARAPEYRDAATMPRMLLLVVRKPAPTHR
jgi:SAM-dependent methyltransferase